MSHSSGNFAGVRISPNINQSGTAGATDLLIDRTETATGSGAQYLFDAQVGGVSRFNVGSNGNVGIGTTTPDTILEIAGTLKLADGSEACGAAADGGMIRYNSNTLQY